MIENQYSLKFFSTLVQIDNRCVQLLLLSTSVSLLSRMEEENYYKDLKFLTNAHNFFCVAVVRLKGFWYWRKEKYSFAFSGTEAGGPRSVSTCHIPTQNFCIGIYLHISVHISKIQMNLIT